MGAAPSGLDCWLVAAKWTMFAFATTSMQRLPLLVRKPKLANWLCGMKRRSEQRDSFAKFIISDLSHFYFRFPPNYKNVLKRDNTNAQDMFCFQME